MPEAPMVKGNALITLGKLGDLLPPAKQVTASSVGKDYGVPLPIGLVMDVNAVYPSFTHVSSNKSTK